MNREALLGFWKIVSWEQRYDDGRVVLPLGAPLEGFIRYDTDGRMCCMIARASRKSFVKGGQWNAPDEEKAQAYSEMLCYAGTYSLENDMVTHHVDISLFPNWKGGEQKRRLSLDGGHLDIIARLEEGTSEARTAILRWERATA